MSMPCLASSALAPWQTASPAPSATSFTRRAVRSAGTVVNRPSTSSTSYPETSTMACFTMSVIDELTMSSTVFGSPFWGVVLVGPAGSADRARDPVVQREHAPGFQDEGRCEHSVLADGEAGVVGL